MKEKKSKGLSIKSMNAFFAIGTTIIAVALVISLFVITNKYRAVEKSSREVITLSNSANDLEVASDYLTEQVRLFAVTGEKAYYDNYFNEANVTKRRDNALKIIKDNFDNEDEAVTNLEKALNESNALMETEFHSFRLVIASFGYDVNEFTEVKDYELSAEEIALSNSDKQTKAINLVFNNEYNESKEIIETNVKNSVKKVIEISNEILNDNDSSLITMMVLQQVMIAILIAFLIVSFLVIYFRVVLPLDHGVELILQGNDLKVEGVKEYRMLSKAYNVMKEKNQSNRERLTYEVEHDNLTGLYNRHGYDSLYHNLNLESTAYILIDVDNFKKINDKYGHAVGDKVLKKVGNVLRKHFRSDDYLCRIGGDEFAVLLSDCSPDVADQLAEKTKKLNLVLQTKDGELPPVSLSIGVAFGNEHDDTDSLFKKADKALYQTKRDGRNGVTVFGSENKENRISENE